MVSNNNFPFIPCWTWRRAQHLKKWLLALTQKKNYRRLVMQCHPDKNPDPQARSQFQKLQQAYEILSDPEQKKVYDQTGEFGDEGQAEGFRSAYHYFRARFKRITEEDINQFAARYKGGQMEQDDLCNFYRKHRGDMRSLLQEIPLSQMDDIPRFFALFQQLIHNGVLQPSTLYTKTKNKLRPLPKEEKQAAVSRDQQLKSLTMAIQQKHSGRDFITALQQKYGKKVKGKTEKPKRGRRSKEQNEG